MVMPEYIERMAAIEYLENHKKVSAENGVLLAADEDAIIKFLREKCPAADVAEVRHGEWKFNKDGSGTCNQCGFTQKNVWDYDRWQNYCGVCGAKMDGKGDEK
jgi:hypothetical protein